MKYLQPWHVILAVAVSASCGSSCHGNTHLAVVTFRTAAGCAIARLTSTNTLASSSASSSAFMAASTPWRTNKKEKMPSIRRAPLRGQPQYRRRFAHSNAQIFEENRPASKNPAVGHPQVAILLPPPEPSPLMSEFDGSLDASANAWYPEAIHELRHISQRLGLPAVEAKQHVLPSPTALQCSHYLTAISCPRTQSYALALIRDDAIGSPSSSSSNASKRLRQHDKKSRKKKATLEPLFVDLCPPSNSRLGYRVRRSSADNRKNGGGGGEELLLKALGIKKMLTGKKNNRADNGSGTQTQQPPLVVYDLTAGWARDSLVILASFLSALENSEARRDDDTEKDVAEPNTRVPRLHMVERDPIVSVLLSDAMRRLRLLAEGSASSERQDMNTAQQLLRCLSMEQGDGVSVIDRAMSNAASSCADGSKLPRPPTLSEAKDMPGLPDVIYLDPMFPPRKKTSAAVKKDMATLQSLLASTARMRLLRDEREYEDVPSASSSPRPAPSASVQRNEEASRLEEEQALLRAACRCAAKRVVVKRPVRAPPMGSSTSDNDNNGKDERQRSVGGGDANVPKPSYALRGSTNRFDVYVIS